MIPFIRSIDELMLITHSRDLKDKIDIEIDLQSLSSDINHQKESKMCSKKVIGLPKLPKIQRKRWIKGKNVMSRFFDELDYNNQIQSSYDLTLLDRQKTHDTLDAA